MAGRIWAMLFAGAVFSWAQGTTPQKSAADYPVQGTLDNGVTVGAEYLVHSIPSHHGSYVVEDYLVLDVGIFGGKSGHVTIAAQQFSLEVSGLKAPIPADDQGIVSSGITVNQMPAAPVPGTDDENMSLQDRIRAMALPDGDLKTPFSGLLYFPFHGKMKTIKSMDLLYDGPAGKMTLKVF